MKWRINYFRHLYGPTFTVVTDHRCLLWLFDNHSPNSRLVRWQLERATSMTTR